MEAFLAALWQLVVALEALVWSLVVIIGPWLPLVLWIVFWLFAVNWVNLREVLVRGGWIGVALIGFMAILVWGTVAPPPNNYHEMFGLTVSNFVGKTVFVSALICIMLLCGAVQLSGSLGRLGEFHEPVEPDLHDAGQEVEPHHPHAPAIVHHH